MIAYIGEIAALGTALFWAVSATNFTLAGKRIGALAVNRYRTLLGSCFLITLHLILFQRAWPAATNKQLLLLLTSSVVGIVIGDSFLFKAYVNIGPRLSLLIFNANPIFTALLALAFLGEKLKLMAWVGIIITLLGALWVIMEEHKNKASPRAGGLLRGILFAVLAAFGQAAGYVLAKPVMIGNGGLPPLSATLIRVLAAALTLWIVAFASGSASLISKDIKDKKAVSHTVIGSLFGAFLGIWFSLIALKYAPAGIAATLISTLPIAMLPIAIFVFKEKISWRAAIGAVISVIGVAIIFNA
ncbi:MAG: DMT family transporter [Deltaproteobacteria bacterium]|nr:DMT family transporter [Deltaproteobacteria bacterium]MBI2342279.1 DMT family transporter [Deltaproteobacteria bacterium]